MPPSGGALAPHLAVEGRLLGASRIGPEAAARTSRRHFSPELGPAIQRGLAIYAAVYIPHGHVLHSRTCVENETHIRSVRPHS